MMTHFVVLEKPFFTFLKIVYLMINESVIMYWEHTISPMGDYNWGLD